MEPIAVTVRGERRWMLIHRCTRCGRLRRNRAAADDNMLLLMQLAAPPLAACGPSYPPQQRKLAASPWLARSARPGWCSASYSASLGGDGWSGRIWVRRN